MLIEMRRTYWVLCSTMVAVAAACVGSDPEPVNPAGDGGASSSSGSSDASSPGSSDASSSDAPADAGCDPAAPFADGKVLPLVVTPDDGRTPSEPTLSTDELTMYVGRGKPTGESSLYVALRGRVEDNFGPPTAVDLQPKANMYSPTLSADGLRLAFQVETPSGLRIGLAKRNAVNEEFTTWTQLELGADSQGTPKLASDGLYFSAGRIEGGVLTQPFQSYRAPFDGADGFGTPEKITTLELATLSTTALVLTSDRTYAYFQSDRPNGGDNGGSFDMFRAKSIGAGWGDVQPLANLNSPGNDRVGWLSPNDCRLYYTSGDGDSKIYVASR